MVLTMSPGGRPVHIAIKKQATGTIMMATSCLGRCIKCICTVSLIRLLVDQREARREKVRQGKGPSIGGQPPGMH
jgi:hypothetical protein